MMIFASQLLSGQNLIGQGEPSHPSTQPILTGLGIQFLQTAGISTDLSFSLNMVLNSMFIIGTVVSWGCKLHLSFLLGQKLTSSAHTVRSTNTLRLWNVLDVFRTLDHRWPGLHKLQQRHHGFRWTPHCSQLYIQRQPPTPPTFY